jgi:YidC/Oxa1 family membrane protein insertase
MGLAIIGFSFALRFILNPLTKPYMESMKRMKEFEPQLAKLKERHKDDKKKLLEAQTEFYKQKGINPGGGCLPYLLQIVVLIALFNVFTRVLAPNGDVVGKFNELLYSPLRFEEGTTINTRFLYLDITRPDSFKVSFLPFAIPGPILILAALFQFLASKMMTPYQKIEQKIAKKTPGSTDDMQVTMQKSMSLTFPLFTLIFGLSFPSGLALYWLLFSFWQLWQQYKTSGWGGLTPFVLKLGLLKSAPEKK